MIDKNLEDFIRSQKKLNTPEEFIPDAADKAEHITCATHPCQFSHPYANQDKKYRVTPIVFTGKFKADGYLRSGNVRTQSRLDMYGSASFAAIMKFLSLPMSNGLSVIENIRDNTEEAQELLKASGQNTAELRDKFLTIFKATDKKQVTSSKIKQIYFPLADGSYHLLSVLTASPLVYELKSRINAINDDAFNKRKQAKKSGITESYRELYNLVRLKYGGTQPQNISKLNTENGGISKLLNCTPPSLADLNVRLPKADFFSECLSRRALKAQFDSLNKLMSLSGDSKIPLDKQRKWRDRVLAEIIDAIIERLFLVREALPEIPANLKPAQKIWLNRAEEVRRDSADWQQEIAQEITEWIIKSYRRLYKNSSVVLGDTEFMAIENTVNSFEELWK